MILVNKSWLELKPNEDLDGNQEWFDEYYSRISLKKDYNHIPKEVLEQWIHPHHKNYETLRNYSWINYENIEFSLCEWNLNQLSKIYVVENFRDYYIDRSNYSDFDQFCCTDEDLNHWKEKGTWRTPPIILDIKSLCSEIPKWSELIPPYQLVEGHSRLGYLQSMKRISDLNIGKIAIKHGIFLMTEKSTNA